MNRRELFRRTIGAALAAETLKAVSPALPQIERELVTHPARWRHFTDADVLRGSLHWYQDAWKQECSFAVLPSRRFAPIELFDRVRVVIARHEFAFEGRVSEVSWELAGICRIVAERPQSPEVTQRIMRAEFGA